MAANTRLLLILASCFGSVGVVWLVFGGQANLTSAICALVAATLVPAAVAWRLPRARE